MTDHEKRIRERIHGDDSLYTNVRNGDLRALLADLDAVPMTDERIVALVLEANAAPVETPTQAMTWIVRAVEAHHGITQRADGGEVGGCAGGAYRGNA